MQEEIFIPLTLFVAMAVVIYQFIKTRHAERMSIIEKGLNEEQLSFLLRTKKRSTSNEWSVKLGALFVGVGLAILIGNIAAPYDLVEETVAGLIFLFPGIGLLLAYKFLDKKEDVNDE
ncbi:MAG: hypothetical protein D8M58_20815 [Calditrichaeota bacterium]|nr:MAG: hypothetical protein DWQ03_01145 [Calditrichota bacterium]MBL1207854.1 hypothetical protein [Calditrichota bacterium]NOG47688.1 hypothetical protein [Calditrichota bacterium]